MNLAKKSFVGALALAGLLFASTSARAQSYGFSEATVTPTNALVTSPIEFTIIVTNLDGFQRSPVFVTNALSAFAITNSVSMVNGLGFPLPGDVLTNNVGVIFRIAQFDGRDIARLTLNLTPPNAGGFTNRVTVGFIGGTNNAATNVAAQITLPPTDLAIAMTNAPMVLTNDTTTIGLFVTNLGPNLASGVVVTNVLPNSFRLLSVVPAATSNLFSGGSNLVLNLGSMASGSSTQVVVSVQPSNAATFQLGATVFAANDTNTVNNSVTNPILVATFLPTDTSINVVTQQMNWQTGLLEMLVEVENNAITNVPAFRLLVSGLTSGTRLYNAIGTNAGKPYVQHNAPLLASSSTNVLLEFYTLFSVPLTNYTLEVEGLPPTTLTAPTNFNITITNYYTLPGGAFMIEFPATIGKTYTITYSDNLFFSNALPAQPSIVAPATRVQWIDSGPPKTISHPSAAGSRFYRVFQAQ